MELHESGYGRTFYERQLPQLIKALERLAIAAERLAPAATPASPSGPVAPPDYMAVISEVYERYGRRRPYSLAGDAASAWKAGVATGVTAMYDRLRCSECASTLAIGHEAHCAQGRD